MKIEINKKTTKDFFKRFVIFFAILTVVLIPVQAGLDKVGGIRVFEGTENLMEDMDYIINEDSPFFSEYADSERVNVLCMGLNDNLADTIMLISYDMKNQRLDLISIPRDTYYYREGVSGASLKINSIYSKEGAVGMAEAVSETLLGMPINYYAVVDYEGVGNIVDAIGGVPMHIDFHMHYEDPYDTPPLYIDFPEGDYVLDGSDAMEFLRFRKGSSGYKGYPEGDIGRIKAQQQFMKNAFSQAIDTGLVNAAKSVFQNVDSDINLGMLTKLATKALFLDKEDLSTYTLPGASGTVSGLSFWRTDKEEIANLVDQIYAEPVESEDAETAGASGSGETAE